ncbi:hypothetical protein Salat_0720300 [Sesamum alatum]|uniref:Uncharacterized protein n=1 Tax=Sesamum alatum TaxID=300844 RepID=A0AAE1YTQ6_9LAMI|nr:hypothetical protein Salat_0720300 [Sesamum alatum]
MRRGISGSSVSFLVHTDSYTKGSCAASLGMLSEFTFELEICNGKIPCCDSDVMLMNCRNSFLFRREFPWKVDGDSIGVSSKLKALEQELLSMERVCKGDLSKQSSDPNEPILSSEFGHKGKLSICLKHFGCSGVHLKLIRS